MAKTDKDISMVLNNIKKEAIEALKDEKPMTIPAELCSAKKADKLAEPILYSEELNFLNANWANFNPVMTLSSHRSLVGPWIVRIKRWIINFFWNNLYRSYFEHEREFNMHLVRHLNDSARYIDARDKEIFWQIIQKLDSEVKTLTERIDYLFTSALATAQSAEQDSKDALDKYGQQLEEIKSTIQALKAKLN